VSLWCFPARSNERGETVNKDLYKVKEIVFVEKGVVWAEVKPLQSKVAD
jgi:hypothetical protein